VILNDGNVEPVLPVERDVGAWGAKVDTFMSQSATRGETGGTRAALAGGPELVVRTLQELHALLVQTSWWTWRRRKRGSEDVSRPVMMDAEVGRRRESC
jgi:hypothetical protein